MARDDRIGLLSRLAMALRMKKRVIVPVVRLSGVIGLSTPVTSGMTLASVARQLDRAFAFKKAPAVALVINSPGGSAAQSHLIHQRIRQLAQEKKKRVIAFVEDVAASGGYMIACAADEIVVDPNSIVGSVGVVSASFGFENLIKKIGVERRVHTAGENKRQLDPFLPERPEDVRRLKALQQQIHDEFIALVKRGRGKRLKGADKTLFTGEYWLGKQALEYGLIDEIGDLRGVLRKRYGKQVLMPLITAPTNLFGRARPGIGSAIIGDDWAETLLSTLEARAIWARYGL